MPGDYLCLDEPGGKIDGKTDQGKNDNAGEDPFRIKSALGVNDQKTETGITGKHFHSDQGHHRHGG